MVCFRVDDVAAKDVLVTFLAREHNFQVLFFQFARIASPWKYELVMRSLQAAVTDAKRLPILFRKHQSKM